MPELADYYHEGSGVTLRITPESAARLGSSIKLVEAPTKSPRTKTNSSKEGK